jgi:hypothetical protein
MSSAHPGAAIDVRRLRDDDVAGCGGEERLFADALGAAAAKTRFTLSAASLSAIASLILTLRPVVPPSCRLVRGS